MASPAVGRLSCPWCCSPATCLPIDALIAFVDEAPHFSPIEHIFSSSPLLKWLKTTFEMDDKTLGFVGDLELADQAGGTGPISDMSNMTRDEREMAFYGKKEQLKVRVLDDLAAGMFRD